MSDCVTMTTNGNRSSVDEAALLKKLEEANRILEADEKSLRTLSGHSSTSKNSGHSGSGHSRKDSGSSIISAASITSNISNLTYEEDPGNCPDDAWVLWGKIVNDWENVSKRRPAYVKELVRKGIPHHFRGIVWQLLCDAHNSPDKERYADYIKKSSPCEKVIRRDIARTYPEHDFFKEKDGLGQESLFNVMKAYSLHDREVGYCQGSGFIVGLLLMQMPEEEAFAVFVKIMQEYKLRELFKPSMAELGLCMFQLECMIQELTPELNTHFQAQGFCTTMFASSWFLTLFTTSLPLPIACRIFDMFLSEGMEIIFKVGMAILLIAQEDLMYRDMEEMLRFFQKDVPACHEANPEPLLQTALQVKYNSRKMKKLEKEYNALKTKEQEEQVELRRLRTENRLLRQRIDNLEKETATLADRLIHDQVIRAQQEEEMYVVRRDLSALKSHYEKTTQKLTQANDLVRDLKDRTSSTDSAVSNGSQNEEVITQLQEELVNVRLEEAEHKCTMREQQDKIRELEELNRRLQQEPKAELQTLQEQLIASKLREAESNLSMKELRQRVSDLDKHWQKHQERSNASPKEKTNKATMQQLADELMSIKLKEAELVADLNEMKQKVMELETQNHICNRQIRRLEDENETLKEKIDEGMEREKEARNQIKELERKITDLESKKKEDSMMVRIKDAEHSQTIAEMRQRIAELEIENQELVTAGQLQEKGETQDLENRIADLQEEVMTLKMARKLQSLSSLALNHMGLSMDMESDYDTDDMETTITDNKHYLHDANSFDSDSLGHEDHADMIGTSNMKRHLPVNDNHVPVNKADPKGTESESKSGVLSADAERIAQEVQDVNGATDSSSTKT